jgi:hypothetical protein
MKDNYNTRPHFKDSFMWASTYYYDFWLRVLSQIER